MPHTDVCCVTPGENHVSVSLQVYVTGMLIDTSSESLLVYAGGSIKSHSIATDDNSIMNYHEQESTTPEF